MSFRSLWVWPWTRWFRTGTTNTFCNLPTAFLYTIYIMNRVLQKVCTVYLCLALFGVQSADIAYIRPHTDNFTTGEKECIPNDEEGCSCKLTDGSGIIDLTSLGTTDNTPRWICCFFSCCFTLKKPLFIDNDLKFKAEYLFNWHYFSIIWNFTRWIWCYCFTLKK